MIEEATIRRLPLPDDPPVTREVVTPERGFLRGQHIVRQGEPCGRLFLVRAGVARESAVSPDGREAVIGLWGPGQVFGRLPPLVEVPAASGVRAMTECRVLSIGPAELRALLAHRPWAAAEILGAVADRARRLATGFERVLWFDVQTRVLERLRELAAEHGRATEAGAVVELPLTQEDLAAMVGASRESVNRAVARLIADRRLGIDRRRYVLRGERRVSPEA